MGATTAVDTVLDTTAVDTTAMVMASATATDTATATTARGLLRPSGTVVVLIISRLGLFEIPRFIRLKTGSQEPILLISEVLISLVAVDTVCLDPVIVTLADTTGVKSSLPHLLLAQPPHHNSPDNRPGYT